jgi:hypothetical protein
MADINMGEAPGAHKPPTASPQDTTIPNRSYRPPKRPRPATPKEATEPPTIPVNLTRPRHTNQDTPPASPTHESPQSQLGLELQSHIAAAVAARTTEIRTTGDEVLELASAVSKKVANWEEKGLQGAASLGRDIRTLVLNFSKSLATGNFTKEKENHQPPPPKHNSYAEATRTSPKAPKAHPKPPKTPQKPPQPEKPSRIFLRLPKDHPARQASPYATMEILRKHLDRTRSAAVKEVQQIPSGLAIWPKDGLGLQLLMECKETLESLIQGAKVEAEQEWAIFVLPNALLEYTGYDGAQVPVSDHTALDEFKLQTGLSPLKFYRSSKNPHSSTLIMAIPEDQACTVPQWTHLFGRNIQIKRKLP